MHLWRADRGRSACGVGCGDRRCRRGCPAGAATDSNRETRPRTASKPCANRVVLESLEARSYPVRSSSFVLSARRSGPMTIKVSEETLDEAFRRVRDLDAALS